MISSDEGMLSGKYAKLITSCFGRVPHLFRQYEQSFAPFLKSRLMPMAKTGVFWGTFDPPTVAHQRIIQNHL